MIFCRKFYVKINHKNFDIQSDNCVHYKYVLKPLITDRFSYKIKLM